MAANPLHQGVGGPDGKSSQRLPSTVRFLVRLHLRVRLWKNCRTDRTDRTDRSPPSRQDVNTHAVHRAFTGPPPFSCPTLENCRRTTGRLHRDRTAKASLPYAVQRAFPGSPPFRSKPSDRSSPSRSTPCGHRLRGLLGGRHLRGFRGGRRYGLIVRLHGHIASVDSPWRCCSSRAAGAGVLRPRRRRQYRPASYSQAESKCVITN